MPQVVVLDACTLYSPILRDMLLRLAELGLLSPRWSDSILAEMAHAILRARPDIVAAQVQHLVSCMTRAFPEAMVELGGFTIVGLPDPRDEHVLAVATATSADVLVTCNVRDFPGHIVAQVSETVVASPDEFLLGIVDENPLAVRLALQGIASDLRKPPVMPQQLITGLRAVAPQTAEALRRTIL